MCCRIDPQKGAFGVSGGSGGSGSPGSRSETLKISRSRSRSRNLDVQNLRCPESEMLDEIVDAISRDTRI